MQLHKDEDAFMVPGMGAQPVPVKEWVAANDNIEDGKTYQVGHKEPPAGWRDSQWDALARTATERFPVVHETLAKSERGQYIGLTRDPEDSPAAALIARGELHLSQPKMIYDPPGGWRYGFPKPYAPLDGETIEQTLLRDGYPQHEIDNSGAKYCRFWEVNNAGRQ